jgi:hypothetical protein
MPLSGRGKAFLGLGLCLVAVIVFIFLREATYLGFAEPVIVETGKGPIRELWFSPGPKSSLLVVSYPDPGPREPSNPQSLVLTLWRVDPANLGKIPREILNFGKILPTTPFPRPSGLRLNLPLPDSWSAETADTSATTAVPASQLLYAISDDGKMVAWFFNGEVSVGPIEKLTKDPESSPSLRIPFPGDLESLVLTNGGSLVSLLDTNVELTTYRGIETPWSVTLNPGDWRLSSRGPAIAAVNLKNGKTGLVTLDTKAFQSQDLSGGNKVQWWQSNVRSGRWSSLFATGNLLVVGNSNGLITMTEFPETSETRKSIPLPPGQSVMAITALDNGSLVAAGNFPGIYLIAKRRIAQQVAFAPPGVRLIAAKGKYLAYATDREVVLMRRALTIRLTEDGKYWIGICFGLLGLLGFVRGCLTDQAAPRAAPSLPLDRARRVDGGGAEGGEPAGPEGDPGDDGGDRGMDRRVARGDAVELARDQAAEGERQP